MPAKRLLPSDSTLVKWQEEGLTHQGIVDRIREREGIIVGRSTVAVAFSRMGMTNKIRYEDWLPWPHIKSIHNDLTEPQRLRLGARLMYGAGKHGNDKTQLETFINWARRVKAADTVIYYNEELPEGWGYAHPRPQDKGLIRYPRGVRAPHVEAFVDTLLNGGSLAAARRAAKAASPEHFA